MSMDMPADLVAEWDQAMASADSLLNKLVATYGDCVEHGGEMHAMAGMAIDLHDRVGHADLASLVTAAIRRIQRLTP